MTNIEFLCRALWKKRLGFLGAPNNDAWRIYEGDVKVLVTAMRDAPRSSKDMREAARRAHEKPKEDTACEMWEAMIDVILAEKP